MLLCVETSVSALNPSNESFSPFPVHYTYVSQLRSCSSSIKSHDKAVKTNLTFNISLIELWFTERNGGKLTPPPGSCSMSRSMASCQSYKEKSITAAGERCYICHSQMNSSYLFPIGQVCTRREFDLTMENIQVSLLCRKNYH